MRNPGEAIVAAYEQLRLGGWEVVDEDEEKNRFYRVSEGKETAFLSDLECGIASFRLKA